MALPRFVALKAMKNQKYVRPYEYPDGETFAQSSVEKIVSPYTKHEVKMSQNHKGMMHVRCCYNNKYWRIKDRWWILADAEKPNEDVSNSSCTMFEPIEVDAVAKTFRLRHAQLGLCANVYTDPSHPKYLCLMANIKEPSPTHDDIFMITDWESLLVLPRSVAFKGDNGKYLCSSSIQGQPYLEFKSDDSRDPLCWNEVFITPDGSIRIKNIHFNAFWSVNSNWILANSGHDNSNPNTLFHPEPVKGYNNVVALRNLGNNKFCKRFTVPQKTSCLSANDPTISQYAQLQVEELINSRHIYNVDFHLSAALIYDEEVITLTTGNVANWSSESQIVAVRLTYNDSWSGKWCDSTAWKLGIITNMTTNIPIIGDAGIQISSDFSETYQWGETKSSITKKEVLYNVTMPPWSGVAVTLLATKAKCDVPFSYHQHDTLFDENQITNYMDDGIYSGINYFKLKYEVTEPKPLN